MFLPQNFSFKSIKVKHRILKESLTLPENTISYLYVHVQSNGSVMKPTDRNPVTETQHRDQNFYPGSQD